MIVQQTDQIVVQLKSLPLLFVMTMLGVGITLMLNQLPEVLMRVLLSVSVTLSIWGSIGLILQLWVRYIKNWYLEQ